MGPWRHGGWAGGKGERLGKVHFGSATSEFFRKNMELPFFNAHLKDAPRDASRLPEAYVFETGANKWRQFDHWPPRGTQSKRLFFRSGGKLAFEPPEDEEAACDEYVSDPFKPVPFTETITTQMAVEYMTDDQRFAARRPDVLAYRTEPLKEDLTLAGPLRADLRVSTSGTDSDWVVKLIDVFPNDAKDPQGKPQGGYQMMVRSEVIRGRFLECQERRSIGGGTSLRCERVGAGVSEGNGFILLNLGLESHHICDGDRLRIGGCGSGGTKIILGLVLIGLHSVIAHDFGGRCWNR